MCTGNAKCGMNGKAKGEKHGRSMDTKPEEEKKAHE
jgi:hypothetical protein